MLNASAFTLTYYTVQNARFSYSYAAEGNTYNKLLILCEFYLILESVVREKSTILT